MSRKKSGGALSGVEAAALTIADLPELEKARITHLVDRLMTLGREHEETMSSLSNERARYASEIDAATRRYEEDLATVDAKLLQQSETIQQLQEQRAAAFSMLKKYQARLESYDSERRAMEKETTDKTTQLNAQVERLEKVVERQRASIDEMEAASSSTKKTLQDTLDLAEQRNRRAMEEIALLKDQTSSSQRRSTGLETAVAGLTKQLASINKAGALKDSTIADLKRMLESQEAAVQKERTAASEARAETARFAEAAAAAAAQAAVATAAAQAAERRKKKALRQVADLAASRTSSEMLLLDTMGSASLGELTPERKMTRKRSNEKIGRKMLLVTEQPSHPSSFHSSTVGGKGRRLPLSGIIPEADAGPAKASIGKKSSREKPLVKSSTLAVELGENRLYDTASVFYVLGEDGEM